MKKFFTLLFIATAFMSQTASAQIKKGEKMLGLNIGVTSSKVEQSAVPEFEAKSANLSIVPQLGFGVGNNWIVGVQAGYNYSKQKTKQPPGGGSTEQKSNTFSGGAFVRKFFPMGERFGLFGQGDVYYAHSEDIYGALGAPPSGEVNTNSIGVGISPGAYYRVNNWFIAEAKVGNLGYEHRSSKEKNSSNKSTASILSLGLTNNLSLGFKVVL